QRAVADLDEGDVIGPHAALDQQLVADRHHFHDLLARLDERADRRDLHVVDDAVDGRADLGAVELALRAAQRLLVDRDLGSYLAALVERLLAEFGTGLRSLRLGFADSGEGLALLLARRGN